MNNYIYTGVTLAAGIGIPVMAALNSLLGTKLGSPVPAAVILFALAFVISLLTLVSFNSNEVSWRFTAPGLAWFYYLGGAFVAFYVLSITWTAPKLGIANAIFLILLGQIIATIVIEHFAWFGSKHIPIGIERLLGVAFMVAGIVLTRRSSF